MRLLNAVFAILLLMSGSARAEPDTAADDDQYKSNRVRLQLSTRNQLAALQGEITKAASDATEKTAITDMVLDVSRLDKKIEDALRSPDGTVIPGNGDSAFTAEVYAVAGGRLYSEGLAICGAFSNEVSRCNVDCDGGGFWLKRHKVTEGFALTLIVGKAAGLPDDQRENFSITDCGESDSLTIGAEPPKTAANIDFVRGY